MLNRITEGDPALPPLLIAHGLYGQARNWGTIARALGDARHVTSVDMRNHGDSPWYDSHSYTDMADDLAQVLDQPTDVLGHSMGGKAAMAMALRHPDRVNRLIVADIAPVPYDHAQLDILRAMQGLDLTQITRRAEAAQALVAAGVDKGVAGFLTQNLDIGGKRWAINLDVLAREMPTILGFPDFDAPFAGPALFLAGANSPYVQPDHRDAIKALFPRAHIARIPGAGHWLHADRPNMVEAAIRTFLTA